MNIFIYFFSYLHHLICNYCVRLYWFWLHFLICIENGFFMPLIVAQLKLTSLSFSLFYRLLLRTIRIWLKRDSGQYWPSICQYMPSGCTALDYVPETRKLFIGQENGTVSQYTLSDDSNSLTLVRDYLAHQARVTGVAYVKQTGWIISCGRDKLFSFHCTETAKRLGGYTFEAMCTTLQYPSFFSQIK